MSTMKRVNFHLTKQQIKFLQQESEQTGLKIAEIIRRCVDRYSDEKTRKCNTRRSEEVTTL